MKKRVLAGLLAAVMCVAMSGCARNEKPMSPDELTSIFSTANESDGASTAVSSSDGGSSVSKPSSTLEVGGNNGGVVVPRQPDGTNDLSEYRALYVGDKVFYADWTPEEFVASGWSRIKLNERVESNDCFREYFGSSYDDFSNLFGNSSVHSLGVEVFNYSGAEKDLAECKVTMVYSLDPTRGVVDDTIYIKTPSGMVHIGMGINEARLNLSSCRLVKTEEDRHIGGRLEDETGAFLPVVFYTYVSVDEEVMYQVVVDTSTQLVTEVVVTSLTYYQVNNRS